MRDPDRKTIDMLDGSAVPESQNYLGNDQVRLQLFNVQVNQTKEEITVDDSFDDGVSRKTITFLSL